MLEEVFEPLFKVIFRFIWLIFRGVFIEFIFWLPELLINVIYPDTNKKRTRKTYLLGWTFIIAAFILSLYLAVIIGNTSSPF